MHRVPDLRTVAWVGREPGVSRERGGWISSRDVRSPTNC